MTQGEQARLVEMVEALSPGQQKAVEEFIRYLQGTTPAASGTSELQSALDEFVRDHSELLRRLSQ